MLLGLQLETRFLKDDFADMVPTAVAADGIVLIAWEHEDIPAIANLILGNSTTVPQQWPGQRFDIVWVFDRQGSGWSFSQVPQLLLSGDSSQPI